MGLEGGDGFFDRGVEVVGAAPKLLAVMAREATI